MEKYIVCCDWGTSVFRLQLVDNRTGDFLKQISSGDGVSTVYREWTSSSKTISLKEFYLKVLYAHLNTLLLNEPFSGEVNQVLISGMASSSIGLEELAYAEVPFSLDGENALVASIAKTDDFPFDIFLISGVRVIDDVMRGEETQILGLVTSNNFIDPNTDVICILPGTHSKHIVIKHFQVVDFKTYLTGELFQLLSTKSVLKGSVEHQLGIEELNELNIQAFYRGIDDSAPPLTLLNKLFSVRTNDLFGVMTKEDNYFYLSGLLIGNEIRSLQVDGIAMIVLCCGNKLYELYKLAIEKIHKGFPLKLISPEVMDKAAFIGQRRIFESYQLKNKI
jgi:2-dehydro-3-deoxygalactonokinase